MGRKSAVVLRAKPKRRAGAESKATYVTHDNSLDAAVLLYVTRVDYLEIDESEG